MHDGKRWTTDSKPISHSIPYTVPPLHFRCRCSMVPVLKTWEELGIDMQELPDGTWASMEGQVNDKTFSDWLKRKESETPGFADKTLGKGRAELFRDGKLTMDQMISGGKPLTLGELKNKYSGKVAAMDAIDKKAFSDWTKQVTQKDYKARHEFKQVGVIPDYVMNDKAVKALNPVNNEIHISDHQLRHSVRETKKNVGTALPLSIVKQLPLNLESADYFFDSKQNNLLAVFDVGDGKSVGKSVIVIDFKKGKKSYNSIVTSGVIDATTLGMRIYKKIT